MSGLSVGELFVDLGIKGSDKTLGALSGVKKGMSDVASTSLEAKAAIVASMYALERFFAISGQTGTGLTNLSTALDVSAQTIQKYDFAARQVGVTNAAMEGTFRSLQSAMAKTFMGGEAPKGLNRVAQLTGDISMEDVERFSRKPEELLQRLQTYASKEKNTALKNEILASFVGNDPALIAAFDKGVFNEKNFKKAPTYSNGEIAALDRANIAWMNLGNTIEMAFGRFNAKHGGGLVRDISKIVHGVIELSSTLLTLGERVQVFDRMGKLLEGSANSLKVINEIFEKIAGRDAKPGDLTYVKPGQQAVPGLESSPAYKFFHDMFTDVNRGQPRGDVMKTPPPIPLPAGLAMLKNAITPKLPHAPSTTHVKTEVKQTFNFQHDGKNASDVGRAAAGGAREVQNAVRQNPAVGQVN